MLMSARKKRKTTKTKVKLANFCYYEKLARIYFSIRIHYFFSLLVAAAIQFVCFCVCACEFSQWLVCTMDIWIYAFIIISWKFFFFYCDCVLFGCCCCHSILSSFFLVPATFEKEVYTKGSVEQKYNGWRWHCVIPKQIRNNSKLAKSCVPSKWAFLLRHLTRSGRKNLWNVVNSLLFPSWVRIFILKKRPTEKKCRKDPDSSNDDAFYSLGSAVSYCSFSFHKLPWRVIRKTSIDSPNQNREKLKERDGEMESTVEGQVRHVLKALPHR